MLRRVLRAKALTGGKRSLTYGWMVVAAALALTGITGSALGAAGLARSDARASRANFTATAQGIASTLRLGIQHEDDLLVSGAAFLKQTRHVTPASFRSWYADVRAAQRYPELMGTAAVALVPLAQLRAWETRALADPPLPLGPHPAVQVIPPGTRPYYCLFAAAVTRLAVPVGIDACTIEPLLYPSRDTGSTFATPAQLPTIAGGRGVAVTIPVYRTAVTPPTIAGRRAAFIGWLGIQIAPKILLKQAIQGHTGMQIVLRRGTDAALAFTAGRAPAGASRLSLDLHDGSSMQVLGAVQGAGILTDTGSTLLMLGGGALSLLLACLMFVLGTSRARAKRLVQEKTGELSFQALHDALTGLPNRALVLDRAEQALARARRAHFPAAALFIDADGFKAVNDTFGHAAGDELLCVIAARLTGVVREADTVGRLGGDEFVVLLEAQDPYVAPDLVAERILEVLSRPVQIGEEMTVSISVSIGIASGERNNADELMRDADLALYAAKAAGKNRCLFFNDSMQTAAADRYMLERDLSNALADDQLFLLYQPTFDLRSGTVNGVEALIRWEHPTKGIVLPDEFIPLAEENAQIIKIGAWVLREACAQAAAWHQRGYAIGMSVNISVRQVEDGGLADVVAAALARSGLEPAALTLEITETVLMRDAQNSTELLHNLKQLGVRIAIDDFGTGYSSLAYLRQFPVDALKIDRSFISWISSSTESAALMHTLVQLGKTLGLETLGEGIEDNTQLECLRREDCDAGQGFLLARPLAAAAVEEFFEQSSDTAAQGPGTYEHELRARIAGAALRS